jgi:hypothetical protein
LAAQERQAQRRDQQHLVKDAANERRLAEVKEHEARGDAHAAAGRALEAVAAYEHAAKSVTSEPARRALLAKAEAVRARQGRKSTLLAVAGAAVVLAVAGGGAWFAFGRGQPTTAATASESTSSPAPAEHAHAAGAAPAAAPAPPPLVAMDADAIERMADDPALDVIAVRDAARSLLAKHALHPERVQAVIDRIGPEAARLEAALADIAAAEKTDPARALSLTAALRSSTPRLGSIARRLPLPARLVLRGPPAEAVRLKLGGAELAADPELHLCRHADAATTVVVSAPGWRDEVVTIPIDASSKELAVPVALVEQPAWTMSAELGAWVELAERGDAVLATWPAAIVVLGAADGAERARLEPSRLSAAAKAWVQPQSLGIPLMISTDDGTGFAVSIAPGKLDPQQLRHGGLATAFSERDLVFHLGKRACFAVETRANVPFVCATSGFDELWAMPLLGKLAPWLQVNDESEMVIDDTMLRVLDQEGQVQQSFELGGTRTSPVVSLAGGRCLAFSSSMGGRVIAQGKDGYRAIPAPRLQAAHDPLLAGDGDALLVSIGEDVELMRWTGQGFTAGWAASLSRGRRALYASLAGGWACIADDSGTVRALRASDGSPARLIEVREEPIAAPIVAGGMVLVADAHGISAYPLKR